ncbi:MAG: hypothetical protein ACI4TV_05250, partial [Paludibacteraceae bacterium]
PLYQLEDGTFISAGDYILGQLAADQIAAPNALFAKIIDEFQAHSHEEGFVAETFFKFHTDPQVSALAVDLIAERYQLSQMFMKQTVSENVVKKIEDNTEIQQLPTTITNLLLELKLTVVNERIDELEQQLKEAQHENDWDKMKPLLALQPQLLSVRNEYCRLLGNRVMN